MLEKFHKFNTKPENVYNLKLALQEIRDSLPEKSAKLTKS